MGKRNEKGNKSLDLYFILSVVALVDACLRGFILLMNPVDVGTIFGPINSATGMFAFCAILLAFVLVCNQENKKTANMLGFLVGVTMILSGSEVGCLIGILLFILTLNDFMN